MFTIDHHSRVPIYEQIISQTERLIATGVLKPNDQLPSVRQAASLLGINPNTIQKAYVELERRGYIYPLLGKGYFIHENPSQSLEFKKKEVYQQLFGMVETLQMLGETKENIIQKIQEQ